MTENACLTSKGLKELTNVNELDRKIRSHKVFPFFVPADKDTIKLAACV